MRKAFLFLLVFLVMCAKQERAIPPAASGVAADQQAQRVASPASPALSGRTAEQQKPVTDRMIIRTANVSLVVANPVTVLQSIKQLVASKNGYVTESREWREDDQTRAHVVMRVPAAQLDETLAAMRKLAIRVENESVSGEDVTEEFSDLGAQLKNMEATEVELRELLTTVRQRTQKASEVLEVYNELTRVRGEIERIQGRMKYLSTLTAMSTINVDLTPDALAAPVNKPGWRPLAVVYEATRALVSTLKVIANAAIWLVIYIVPIGAIFVALVLALRAARRRMKAPAAE